MGFELFGRKKNEGASDEAEMRQYERDTENEYSTQMKSFQTNAAEDVVTGRSIPPTSEFVGTAEAILKRFRERAG
jgi:hypothetical protein